MQAYNIKLTPTSCYTPEVQMSISSRVLDIQYGGWTDDTYVFVLPSGQSAAMFEVKLKIMNELNRVMYKLSNIMTSLPLGGMSVEIP